MKKAPAFAEASHFTYTSHTNKYEDVTRSYSAKTYW